MAEDVSVEKKQDKKECPVCKGTEFYSTSVGWGINTPDGFKTANIIICANPKCNIVLALVSSGVTNGFVGQSIIVKG